MAQRVETNMAIVDERTERLIVRRLDGEATADQQRELDEILAHSGPARQLLAEYERNDRVATEAIDRLVGGPIRIAEPLPARRSRRLAAWSAWSAAAAAVVLLCLWPVDQLPVGSREPVESAGPVAMRSRTEPSRTAVAQENQRYFAVYDEQRDELHLFTPQAVQRDTLRRLVTCRTESAGQCVAPGRRHEGGNIMGRMTLITVMVAGSIIAAPAVAEMPGWLGVSVGPVPRPLAEHLRLQGQGVMVLDVVIGSPADAAGLKRPDLILSIDGASVPGSAQALIDMMRGNRVGQVVTMEILRRGQRETVKATLAQKPDKLELRYRHGPLDEEWFGDDWPWGKVYRWGQDGWGEIDRDKAMEKLRDGMRRAKSSPALRDRYDQAKRDMEHRLEAMEQALRDRGLYPLDAQPEPGSPPERMIARVVRGDTVIELTVDGDRITVRRSARDSQQQGESRTYDTPAMLRENDPEAFEIYEKMVGPRRPGPPMQAWRQRLPSRDEIDRSATDALEQARERIDQLKQELRRQADRLDDVERVKEEFRRQADRLKDMASKVIRPDEPTIRFAVDPDGRIEATLRRGDGELILRFKDEAQLAERAPELHDRFRELHQTP